MVEKHIPLCLAPYPIPLTGKPSTDAVIKEANICKFREQQKEEAICTALKDPTDTYKKVCPVLQKHADFITIISRHTPER